MNKQSWHQQAEWLDPLTPLIEELLDDYFAAEIALRAESGPVLFRGRRVRRGLLITRLREEAARCGVDEVELGVAFTQRWNALSD